MASKSFFETHVAHLWNEENGHIDAREKARTNLYSPKPMKDWLAIFKPCGSCRGHQCFERAGLEPPISANSLSELEVESIHNNARLRHDINFNPELYFRPNLDGPRGLRKIRRADRYWHALEIELQLYAFLLYDVGGEAFRWTKPWTEAFHCCQRRVPGMFKSIRDILLAMVSPGDKYPVTDVLDVALISQQIEHGTFDTATWAKWMAQFIKDHCAPIRDTWVDAMEELIVTGVEEIDTSKMVLGLKEMFGILEAMKLDVANHQIRHLRPALLESTVHFEQSYHKRKLTTNALEVIQAREWYRLISINTSASPASQSPLSQLTSRLVYSLMSDAHNFTTVEIPELFNLDLIRLHRMRDEIDALVYIEMCSAYLCQRLRRLSFPPHSVQRIASAFCDILPALVGPNTWLNMAQHISVEIARILTNTEILSSSNNGDIPHNGQYPQESFECLREEAECWLLENLPPTSDGLLEQRAVVKMILIDRISTTAEALVDQSPWVIAESLVPRLRSTASSTSSTHSSSTLEQDFDNSDHQLRVDDLVRRFAHIVVLHWKVWGQLAYSEDNTANVSIDIDTEMEESWFEDALSVGEAES